MNAHVLEFSVRVMLMAAATAAVLQLFRIRGAAARHAAWTAVLAFMLIMPAWTVWGPKVDVPVLPEARREVFEPFLPAGGMLTAQPGPAIPANAVPSGKTTPREPDPAVPWPWAKIALGCYIAGAGVMIARLIAGTLQARALVSRAIERDGIFTSPDCAAPVTLGWFRPAILLPANWRSWPAAELDAVLLHEREHARRRDPLVQWLALLNRAIFWFHPLAWWLQRKLAALAEDACDAAVLRRGHDPRAYSEYLVHLARAVERAGARLPEWGTAIDGGGLAARIRRILEGAPMQRVSRRRATAAAALCGLALALFGACNPQNAQKPAPGQLSMNEMRKRRAAEGEAKAAENKALLDEAKSMTPEQAAAKVATLKADPQNARLHYQLMRYYEFHSDWKGKHALILWYIEHEPGGKVRPWNIPTWDGANYGQGKRLWLAHVRKPGATAEIYERAAAFLQGADKQLAEEILLAGRKAYPDDTRWGGALGEHYAMALLGAAEPRTEYNVIRTFRVAEAQGPYAQTVRAKLEQSTDSRMLAQTARWLTAWGRGSDGRLTADNLALAKSYASRAVALDRANEAAQSIEFRILLMELDQKLTDLRKLPAEEQKKLGENDRLLLLQFEMHQAWSPTGKKPDLELASAKARELLDLAKRAPGAPRSGYAVFTANMTLGYIALRKGDKREAAQYLLAAADAPASEELKRDVMSMNLPRALIDWGERDAAAQFLERIAPKTLRAKELQDWAAQIRKGVNPDMTPVMVGCGQEPC